MKMILWGIVGIVIGFFLSGVWLGITIGLDTLNKRLHWKVFPGIVNAVAALPALLIIMVLSGKTMFHFSAVFSGISWIAIICTVLVTVWIVSFYKYSEKDISTSKKELLLCGFDGLLMEVPQRWMMQTCLLYLFSFSNIEHIEIISTVVTSVVWCVGISVEAVMEKAKPDANFGIELVSSFFFSLGVGIVFAYTELILFPMVAHFGERVLSNSLRIYKCKKNRKHSKYLKGEKFYGKEQ